MDRIKHLMETLDISEQEAIQVINDDNAIDHGAKLFELDPEQKKVEKKMRQADRKVTAYKFPKKERKANEPKRKIIQTLSDALIQAGMVEDDSLHIENVEREFLFTFEGVKYKIVLSAPRK